MHITLAKRRHHDGLFRQNLNRNKNLLHRVTCLSTQQTHRESNHTNSLSINLKCTTKNYKANLSQIHSTMGKKNSTTPAPKGAKTKVTPSPLPPLRKGDISCEELTTQLHNTHIPWLSIPPIYFIICSISKQHISNQHRNQFVFFYLVVDTI